MDAVYSSVEYIFGFGSLVSHPGFEYSEVVQPCYIRGYRWVLGREWVQAGLPPPPGTPSLLPCGSWRQSPLHACGTGHLKFSFVLGHAGMLCGSMWEGVGQVHVLAGRHRPQR